MIFSLIITFINHDILISLSQFDVFAMPILNIKNLEDSLTIVEQEIQYPQVAVNFKN